MKISKTKLHKIIKEEVASVMEAPKKPLTKTVDMYQQARRKKRAQSRQTEKDFFGTDAGLTEPDTKAYSEPPPRTKPKGPGADDPWGLKQIRQQRADVAAARGGTVAMEPAARKSPEERRRDKDRGAVADFMGADDPLVTKMADPDAPADPDKTVAATASPERDARDAEERELAGAKQATHRSLQDPKRISIMNFDSDVREKLVEAYSQKAAISVDDQPLGYGEFGIVYKGENPEYGPVAVKMTLSGQEINAYKNIKLLKEGLESREPEVGNVLPTILDITAITSPPVKAPGQRPRYVEAEDGEKYKVFVVQMELLKPLDSEIRSDIFGPSPVDEYSPEVMKRFVDEYLSVENIYSSLEDLFGDMRWEKVLAAIQPQPTNEGPTGRSVEIPKAAQKGSLPIQDERAFPPFREIDKLLPRLRKAYVDASKEGRDHFFALKDIHKILATQISRIFAKYIEDDNVLGQLEGSSGYILPAKMAANAKLPQYDPEAIEASPGLRSAIMPPSELQTTVAKNFYQRLKKLEKYDAQYGDVHANNVMMRENGDLVVADVGLFMFGKKGDRGYAGSIAERFKELAGII